MGVALDVDVAIGFACVTVAQRDLSARPFAKSAAPAGMQAGSYSSGHRGSCHIPPRYGVLR